MCLKFVEDTRVKAEYIVELVEKGDGKSFPREG
jgi:hypothetical protein